MSKYLALLLGHLIGCAVYLIGVARTECFLQYADKNSKIWLDTLQDKIDNLLFLEEFTFCSGYQLAKSQNAFNGFRLVVDSDKEFTRIASTSADGKLNKITTDRLILDQICH
jgi:hypothetical protein